MKTNEIYSSTEEFKKFVSALLGDCHEFDVSLMNVDTTNDEIKFKYENETIFPGLFITSYKKGGSWSDIKVHIKPRVVSDYKLKFEDYGKDKGKS